MNKLSIDQIDLKGKKVLVRVDFNVPLNENLEITDDIRISAALPTIKKIIADGGKAILMSHLGRPKGEKKPEYSLKPTVERLSQLLEKEVKFSEDCIGEPAKNEIAALSDGNFLIFKILRYYNS